MLRIHIDKNQCLNFTIKTWKTWQYDMNIIKIILILLRLENNGFPITHFFID